MRRPFKGFTAQGTAVIVLIALALALVPASAEASFGFPPSPEGFSVGATNLDGTPLNRAGFHPYAYQINAAFNTSNGSSDGDLRDLRISLPSGFLVSPTAAVPACSAAAFDQHRVSPFESSASGESCPDLSQVGVIGVDVGGDVRHFGLFNLESPPGTVASLGASPFDTPLVFNVNFREDDDGLDLDLEDVPSSFDLQGFEMTIWGAPWIRSLSASFREAHETERGNCLNEIDPADFYGERSTDPTPLELKEFVRGTCAIGDPRVMYEIVKSDLTLPAYPCGSELLFSAIATSWQGGEAQTTGGSPPLEKCNKPLTTPKLQLMTGAAAARTGLAVNLNLNDGGGILNPLGIARPALSTLIASLPEGLTVNPSLGAGLGTCGEAEFADETATSEPGAGCPNDSKIGTVTVEGALGLAEPLDGSVYLATPYRNPYDSLIGVYLLARNPRRGIIVKSRGHLEPDPHSGRLLATFEELPRLLYTHFNLTLREGQRSTFVSPPVCGSYLTDVQFSSWAGPAAFHEPSIFLINSGVDDGPCPAGGVSPFAPALLAGSVNPTAAAQTPFTLRMTRTDPEQEITSYSATLPPGLLASLRGIPFCSDAAIEAARARTGIHGATEELQAPSCPAASQIGHTTAGYGVGGTLAWAPGSLYLAGPYHGAPLSTVAIDSALIGPFDLGVVVVRSAIRVDPRTAQVSIDSSGSDPIPHIIRGIPLHLRDIRVQVDRPDFTLNPTSCDPSQVVSNLTGAGADLFSPADDSRATSAQRYQLLNCAGLPFKPRLKFRFRSGVRRRAFPSVRAEYRAAPNQANLHFVSVTLPRTEFIAQEHLREFCTTGQFAADACPPDSVYGKARAFTPLLDRPLEGPVYLRSSSSGGLPDMVFDLRGAGGIRIEAVGHIDSVHEGLRATFTGLPDAPVSRVVMTLYGGKKGLIQNEKNICAIPQFANARLIGQNNLGEAIKPRLETRCPKP